MAKKKDEDIDFEQARKDDRNLNVAGKRWEEDIDDPAIQHLRLIREDVEMDD
jgi:hypothetical protein